MKAFKRSSLIAVVTAGAVALLSGCSDYPTSGVIDTKVLRSEAAILEVEGNVYGIKAGGMDAFTAYVHDRRVLHEAPYIRWNAIRKGEEPGAIELMYTGDSDGFDLDLYQTAVNEAVLAAQSELDEKLGKKIADLQAQRDEMAAKLEQVSGGAEQFEAHVADSKTEYEAAEKALSDAIDAYNTSIERPLEQLNQLAEANGLQRISSSLNPVRNYRSIDYSNRAVPQSCPGQRGYTPVDLRAEQKLCAYIRIPSGYDAHAGEIAAFTKKSIIEISRLKADLGSERSWGRNASGAYAVRDQARKAYENRVSEARSQFGDDNSRKREQQWLGERIDYLDKQLSEQKSDDYRELMAGSVHPQVPQEIRSTAGIHVEAAYKNALAHIEKGPAVTLDGEEAEFSGIDGGYEGVIILAEFIAEARGRRDALPTIHYLDLTSEAIQESDELRVELSRDSFRDARRIDMRDEQEIEEGIMKLLRDVARDKAREKAA